MLIGNMFRDHKFVMLEALCWMWYVYILYQSQLLLDVHLYRFDTIQMEDLIIFMQYVHFRLPP